LIPKPRLKTFGRAASMQASPHATRRAHFNAADGADVPVWHRSALLPGMRVEGPAIIEEKTSTIVLYPGQRAQVDEYLNIEVELPGA
jgi:N-methylhydantoinase A